MRPDDLVILELELVGLVVARTRSGPTIAAQQGEPERRLIFRLPPQHIAERAYYDASATGCDKPETIAESESPDAPGSAVSRIALPSRIVFDVPEALLPLALSFDALLAWHRFELVVPPACRAADQQHAPIAEPAAGETALELPWRLLLAPEQGSGWHTTASTAVRAGRVELWRAALGHIRDSAFEPASQTSTVPIRAVWSPDWRPPQEPWLSDLDLDIPFRTSLRPSDRHELVVLTSGFQGYAESQFNLEDSEFKPIPVGPGEIALESPLQRLLPGLVDRPTPYRPLPAQASRLWVSSLGASLRSAGSWKAAESLPEDRLSRARVVLEDAVARLGIAGARLVARDVEAADERERDNLLAEAVKLHEDRILAQAALQPEAVVAVARAAAGGEPTSLSHWSHDAVFGRDQKVVVVHEGALFPFGHRAALVRVTERRIERTVAAGGTPVANLYQYTYIVVRQRTRTLTLTAPQARAFPFGVKLEVLTTVTPHLSPPEGDAIAGAPSAFWIRVASGGGSSRLPFSCAGRDATGERFTFSTPLVFVPLSLWTDQAASATVASAYTKAAPAASVARQRVALAPARSRASTETTLVVDVMTLTAQASSGGPATWVPAVAAASVEVPDIARISGPQNAGRTMSFDAGYIASGLAGLGVWARVGPLPGGPSGLGLSAGASGGVAVPEFSPSALSRELGPTVAAAVGGGFDASTFFPDTATLFGVVKLKQLVQGGDASGQAPKLTSHFEPAGSSRPTAVVTDLSWNPNIRGADLGIPPFVVVDRSDATLELSATVRRSLDGGPGSTIVHGVVHDLKVSIAGSVEVDVSEFRFGSADGAGARIDVQLGGVEFIGPLKFLAAVQEKLQEFSSLLGGPGGPTISVDAQGIRVDESIALPPFALAVFALHDVRLTTGVTLPLQEGRPSLRFGVAERHHPFALTISLLGGGGYLELEVDTEGIRALDAALEFGGEFQLEIGVASGGVRLMAGFFFTYDRDTPSAVLGGFVEASGFVSVLGIITISIVIRLELGYDLGRDKIHGAAEMIVSVKILGFSKSVSLRVERSFGADGGDPDFAMLVAPADWDAYAEAFA